MNYRNRKHLKRAGFWLLVLVAVIGNAAAVYGVYYCYRMDLLVRKQRAELSVYEKEIYVAVADMSAGDIVLEENICLQTRYSDENQELYMTKEDVGKVLTTDICAGSCLTKSMLKNEAESLREVLITRVEVSEHLKAGNRVDVRISFGNAEDYVVLAEKQLVYCDEKEGIVLKLSEEEILLLSSALHDCSTYKDTELYLVKYPEFQRMKESEVNYIPNREVLSMLGKNDEDEKRIQMENRLEKK